MEFYSDNKDWVDFIKDIVFFLGAVGFIKFLYNRRFNKISELIRNNLSIRKNIGKDLEDYVISKSEGPHYPGAIRFIYWKNYPHNLNNDAFPHLLFAHPYEENHSPSGYVNNTGISFVESRGFVFAGTSIYIDVNTSIFFIDEKGRDFTGFIEVENPRLIFHMPFYNIINYDFLEFIEYEPIFYTRYPYTKRRKLYDDEVRIEGKGIITIESKQSLMLQKYSKMAFYALKFKKYLTNLMS